MKYRVSGQYRETASRTSMEIEANSRAAAQKKAENAGIDVHRIEEMPGPGESADEQPVRGSRGPLKLIRLAVLIVLLLVLILYLTGRLGSPPATSPDETPVEYGRSSLPV